MPGSHGVVQSVQCVLLVRVDRVVGSCLNENACAYNEARGLDVNMGTKSFPAVPFVWFVLFVCVVYPSSHLQSPLT